jgi:hypothetical protein
MLHTDGHNLIHPTVVGMTVEGPLEYVGGVCGGVATSAYVFKFDGEPHILVARGEGLQAVVWWFRPGGTVHDVIIADNLIMFTREGEAGAAIGIIELNNQMHILVDQPSSPTYLPTTPLPIAKKLKKNRKRRSRACPYATVRFGGLTFRGGHVVL